MLVKNKQEDVAIKKLLKDGRRDRAMSLLKLKKIREKQVSNCQASYFKMEELVCSLNSFLLKSAMSAIIRPEDC